MANGPTDVTKKPNSVHGYSDFEFQEVLKCTADPVYFMENYVKVQHPMLGDVKFKPYKYQTRMIEAFNSFKNVIALTARQMGKTTCAGSYLLWKAMFTPNTKILIVANNFQGALEIMDRVRYSYETTPDWLRAGVKEYNKGQIKFDNGSVITSRASGPNAARGLSLTLLYCDEFAFLSPTLGKQFWTSVQPTLSTGGSCIITSTPKSDADQFAEIWRGAIDQKDDFGNPTMDGVGIENEFHPIMVKWDEHPDRNESFERKQRGNLGDAKFRQEHCCEFVSDDLTLIDPEFLLTMRPEPAVSVTGPPIPNHPLMVRWFKDIEPNRTYLAALDPSYGSGGDPAAIQVYELPSMQQVAEWSHRRVPLMDQVGVLKDILHTIDDEMQAFSSQRGESQIFWTVENNNMGAASVTVIAHTGEEKFPGTFLSEKRKRGQRRILKGMTTSPATKKAACVRFKSLLETGRMKICSHDLIKELKFFVTNANSAAAKPGETDDLVMATILCVRMLEQVTAWDENFADLHEVIMDEEEAFSGGSVYVM